MALCNGAVSGLFALVLLSAVAPVQAAANLVVDGDFEGNGTTLTATQIITNGSSTTSGNNPGGQVLPGWTNDSYTFLFTSGTSDTTGSRSTEYNNQLVLQGPGNATPDNNGLTKSSPNGGNFIGMDGAYLTGPAGLSQTITGLKVGQAYALSFYWAGAQQTGFTGATSEGWGVTFGSQTYSVSNSPPGQTNQPSGGFTPWTLATTTFVASATSQTLSFLATGAPSGTPPFSLLDGVSLVAAPEPSTWVIMTAALVGSSLLFRARRRRDAAGSDATGAHAMGAQA